MARRNKNQSGFTIIELMIATTIFSLILMLCLAGILQITKMYYQGVTTARTQDKAREVVDEIAETLRYSSSTLFPQATPPTDLLVVGPDVLVGASDDTNYLCIGSKRYTYALDRQLKSSSPDSTRKQKAHVLWVDTISSSCTGSIDLTTALTNGKELLSENMRLTRFDIAYNSSSKTYQINIGVAYGDEDLLETSGTTKACKSAFTGTEFCAVSNISLTAERRL